MVPFAAITQSKATLSAIQVSLFPWLVELSPPMSAVLIEQEPLVCHTDSIIIITITEPSFE